MGTKRLARTETLAPTDVTRQNFYDLQEKVDPLAAFGDSNHFEIVGNQLALALNISRWRKIGDGATHTDLQAGALENDIELVVVPARTVVMAVLVKHSEAFAGDFSEYKVSVGVAGTLTKYSAPFDVMQAVGDTVLYMAHQWGAETWDSGGTSIRLSAVAVDGDLDTSTAGILDAYMMYGAPQ